MAKANKSSETEIELLIDRRNNEDRRADDRRQGGEVVAVERRVSERRSVQRRRQIDPTTCERDYTDDEIEFMRALDEYKRKNGRMFPTCSEILEVVRDLGYTRDIGQSDDAEADEQAEFADSPNQNSTLDTFMGDEDEEF